MDSRLSSEDNSIRRRRKCPTCEKRFTTYELIEVDMPEVVKNDGRRESYLRDKILSGIKKACQKRPVSTKQIEELVDSIEKNILDLSHREISSQDIGNLVMHGLRHLDPVAYVRFASVYKTFKDIDEFVNDIRDHMKNAQTPAKLLKHNQNDLFEPSQN